MDALISKKVILHEVLTEIRHWIYDNDFNDSNDTTVKFVILDICWSLIWLLLSLEILNDDKARLLFVIVHRIVL
ncbi:MAG: hypothetical protein K2I03_12350 [Lachnospiraceae bacterium]|nr:hypothetical protein [Lachnospiraceae bacterium]